MSLRRFFLKLPYFISFPQEYLLYLRAINPFHARILYSKALNVHSTPLNAHSVPPNVHSAPLNREFLLARSFSFAKYRKTAALF